MPELAEIKVLCDQLNTQSTGKIISVESNQYFPLKIEKETQIKEWSNVGKYLVGSTTQNKNILINLGMSGQLRIDNLNEKEAKHRHVSINILNKNSEKINLQYVDPRRFGRVDYETMDYLKEKYSTFKNMGPDPFQNPISVSYARGVSGGCVKGVLLGQVLAGGVGNYLADETCYNASLHPETGWDFVLADESVLEELLFSLTYTVKEAYKWGGNTMKDYRHLDGTKGQYQNHLKVFGRQNQPCLKCGEKIVKVTVAQRGTYYCPKCQIKNMQAKTIKTGQ